MATKLVSNVGDSLLLPSNYGYHRKCYQLYTNKKNLNSAKRKPTVVDSRPQKRTRQSEIGLCHVVQNSASVFGNKCIICNKNKYIKNKNSGAWWQECLKTCQSKTVETAIKSAAKTKNCDQVLLIVGARISLLKKPSIILHVSALWHIFRQKMHKEQVRPIRNSAMKSLKGA